MIFRILIIILLFPLFLFSLEAKNLLENEDIIISEYELKAVFIYHFIKYFEWIGLEDKEYFEIEVFGKSEILEPLEEISKKKSALGKKIKVISINSIDEIGEPQILFISKESTIFLSEIIKKTENIKVLVIGEEEGLCEKGIAINLVLREGNIKFEINEAILKNKGIKPSSQILKLAIRIIGEKE